jgi:hypothetical protein
MALVMILVTTRSTIAVLPHAAGVDAKMRVKMTMTMATKVKTPGAMEGGGKGSGARRTYRHRRQCRLPVLPVRPSGL